MTRKTELQRAREAAGGDRNGVPRGVVETEIEVPKWPDPPAPEAFRGVFGRVVDRVAPHTEADPAGVLLQLLVGFGNLCGRSRYVLVESTRHYPNLFACLVGRTGRSRKGTSWRRVHCALAGSDRSGWAGRVESGLSSGEGLIWAVRDEVKRIRPVVVKGRITSYQDETVSAAVSDKRLMVVEEEFSRVLVMGRREGNILAAVIRQAWDTGTLRSLVKTCPAQATGAHVSLIGHITQHELLARLGGVGDAHNGFLNRFLWACVGRSKLLPRGGGESDLTAESVDLKDAAELARGSDREMALDAAADRLWRAEYEGLTADRPGLYGLVTGRSEAQALRLALVYALGDGADAIGEPHLRAALALQRYLIDSAAYVFGDLTGDMLADEIEAVLKERPLGMSQTDIHNYFNRNKSKVQIENALRQLKQAGKADWVRHETGKPGRPPIVWNLARPPVVGGN
jgi:hypothetical protein